MYRGEQTSVNVSTMSAAVSVRGNAVSIMALARLIEFVRKVLCSAEIYGRDELQLVNMIEFRILPVQLTHPGLAYRGTQWDS